MTLSCSYRFFLPRIPNLPHILFQPPPLPKSMRREESERWRGEKKKREEMRRREIVCAYRLVRMPGGQTGGIDTRARASGGGLLLIGECVRGKPHRHKYRSKFIPFSLTLPFDPFLLIPSFFSFLFSIPLCYSLSTSLFERVETNWTEGCGQRREG